MTLPRPEDLHTADQAAEALNLPPHLVRRWAREEKLTVRDVVPARGRLGHAKLFALDEIEQLAIEYRRRHASTAP